MAQSNSRGGMIVVGIDDKTGRINPLSFVEVQETTNLLGSLASEGVVPQILLDIENVQMEDGVIVVATVKQGKNKPYRDSKGIVWVKQGADKRKVFDNAELILPVPSPKSNSTGVSEGVSNRVPNGVSDTAKAIYSHIQADPNISRNELVNLTGISLKNVQKHINRLKELGLIRRIGSTRFGYWEIIE